MQERVNRNMQSPGVKTEKVALIEGWHEIKHVKNPVEIKSSKLERGHAGESLEKNKGEQRDNGRVVVRVTSLRRKLLDEDNLCAKPFVDAIRRAGVIFDDNPEATKIEITQEKVGAKEQEGTQIEIYGINETKL
jgi:hypothetical protein